MPTSFRAPPRTAVRALLGAVLAGLLLPLTMLAGAGPALADPPRAGLPPVGSAAPPCAETSPVSRVSHTTRDGSGPGLLPTGVVRRPADLGTAVEAGLRRITPGVCAPAPGRPPREAEPESVPDHVSGARAYLGHSTELARRAAAGRPPPAVAQAVTAVAVPAAQPWRGGPGGCTGTDPTSGRGCLTDVARHALGAVATAFGPLEGGPVLHAASCWDAHAWNPASDHPRGRACDLFPTTGGTFPQGQELANGWRLAEWLRANAGPLHVSYLIWQGRYWDPSVPDTGGWGRRYSSSVYDVRDATGGHFDHVHVSFAP
ncbi:MAG: hypothetical protein OJJ54_06810 [Pseudonocardia sp.]|nr:hypothetical protein [Pseudonocardia sp.]